MALAVNRVERLNSRGKVRINISGLAQLPGPQPIVGKQGVDDASWVQFFSHGVGFRLATHLFGMARRYYAHTVKPIAYLAGIHALKEIFLRTHNHHRYIFEPQSAQYLAHGDLWDHLYQRSLQHTERTFLPLTLEMGSWMWVKKNPRQLFSRHRIFNPQIEHRHQRTLRC